MTPKSTAGGAQVYTVESQNFVNGVEWHFDSGATDHICSDQTFFSSFKNESGHIKQGDGDCLTWQRRRIYHL